MSNPPESDLPKSENLARAIKLGLDATEPWQPAEVQAVFEYELTSPLPFELHHLQRGKSQQLKKLCAAEGLLLRSLGDLIHHPRPPLELLRLTKEYAKANLDSTDSSLPRDVALLIYYASIAAALLRCHARISKLSTPEMTKAFAWALSNRWLDEQSKNLFAASTQALELP